MEITYDVSNHRGNSRWYPHKIERPEAPYSGGWKGSFTRRCRHDETTLQGVGLEEEEKMYLSYTPKEIGAMYDRNNNFRGKQANFEKLQLYRVVKRDLLEFMEHCDSVQVVDGYDPNVREKHAMLWMDFSPAATLDKKEAAALTAIMNKADGVIVADVGDYTRISFLIRDIWKT